jgi:hypothetical protein
MEDMLRELTLQSLETAVYDPHKVVSITLKIREAKVIVAKLRSIVSQGAACQSSLWLPPRYSSRISRIMPSEVLGLVRGGGEGAHRARSLLRREILYRRRRP